MGVRVRRVRQAAAHLLMAAVAVFLALALPGCGGGGSSDSSSLHWNAGGGGALAVKLQAAAAARAEGAELKANDQVRVHVQANGVDVVDPQVVDLPAAGGEITVTFPWVPSTGNTIFVEVLDGTGNVTSSQTASFSWSSNPSPGGTQVLVAQVTIILGPTPMPSPSPSPLAPLSISPAAPSVAPLETVSFTASGGQPPYAWTLSTNQSDGTIDAASGSYTAGPTSPAGVTDVVTLTDSLGSSTTANVSVSAALQISPTTATKAPGATQQFTASGGKAPYTWSLPTNASGGSVNASGLYTAGNAVGSDVVRVTDALGATADATVTVKVALGSPAGLFVDASGIYFSDYAASKLYFMTDMAGTGLTSLSVPSPFGLWRDSTAGGGGKLYVASTNGAGGSKLYCFDNLQAQPTTLTTPQGEMPFSMLYGVTVD